MALSYTQNLEDYHLALALEGTEQGFYIDVGGGHPLADNVSYWFYERGWHGIVVEPQDALAALYPRVRPRDVISTSLVGRTVGTAAFHEVDRLHGFSTTVTAHADGAGQFGAGYATREVAMTTLAALCEQQGVTRIDFLKVDVEGAEADVLAGNDWTRYRPRVVVVEAIAPGSNAPAWESWEADLLAKGYTFTLFDTLNRFYVANEATDVLARAPRERAPWDSATHMYEIGRAPENANHPDHALARDLARGLWASLPLMTGEELAGLLARARGLSANDTAALARDLESEAGRGRLARIACGYDGGQIYPDT